MRTEIVTNMEGSSHFPRAQEGGQVGQKNLLMSGEGVRSQRGLPGRQGKVCVPSRAPRPSGEGVRPSEGSRADQKGSVRAARVLGHSSAPLIRPRCCCENAVGILTSKMS